MLKAFLKKWHIEIVVFATYFILPFLFYLKSPLAEAILGRDDNFFYNLPFKIFVSDHLLNGIFPLWNPYNLCGTPFLAEMESGIFYPFNWLFFVLSPEIAFNLNIMFHCALVGFFTFLYLKHLKLYSEAAFFGGLAFMFSGFMIAHKEHINVFQAVAWLPLVMLIFEKLAHCKKLHLGLWALGSMVFSLQILAGHIQFAVITAVMVFLRFIFFCFSGKNIKALFFSLLLIGILASGLSYIQIFPTYGYYRFTFRGHMPYEFFSQHAFSPISFLLLFFPHIFGTSYDYWGNQLSMVNLTEHTSYAGFLVYLFAVMAVCFVNKNKMIRYHSFLVAFAIFMMLGFYNPFYSIVYHIPILNLFRSPCRYNLVLLFSLSTLAAYGYQYILSLECKKKIFLFVAAFLFIFAVFLILLLTPLRDNFFALIVFSTQWLSVLKSHAHSFSIANPAIFAPIVFLSLSAAIICIKLFVPFSHTMWRAILCVILFFDLFFASYFLGENSTKTTLAYATTPISKKITKDKNFRSLVVHGTLENREQIMASISPNLNMIRKIRMAGAQHCPLVSETTRKILNLHPYGHNEDSIGLLANNKILSAYSIKYILLNKYSQAMQLTNFVPDVTRMPTLVKSFDISTIKSFDGNYKGQSFSVNLPKFFFYEISLEAKGKNSSPLYVSVYSKKLKKDIVHYGFHKLSNKWQFYRKFFLVSHSAKFVCNVYSRSKSPINLRHIKIYKYPLKIAREPKYQQVAIYKDVVVLENKNALPLAYCVNKIRFVGSFSDYYQKATSLSNKWQPQQNAYVENHDLFEKKWANSKGKVTIKSQGLNFFKMVSNNKENHFLVVADSFLPGWRAWIDGKETKIYKTNGFVKGIYLPKGKHEIVLRYQPQEFYWGIFITCLSLFLWVFIVFKYLS